MLARWFVAAWPEWYGPEGPGDAAADLAACAGDSGSLPFAVVAFDAAGRPQGTAALKATGLGDDRAPGPWLGALLVAPEHRRQGIGNRLIGAVEAAAWARGDAALYAAADDAAPLFLRRGWRDTGRRAASRRGPVAVLSIPAPVARR